MAEFIFMLTHHDSTVPNALEVYETLRDSGLRHVGFKDVGLPVRSLAELARRMREDGRTTYLEVVSTAAEDELRSIRAARDIGVNVVMGGTQADKAVPLLAGSGIRYYPFPGHVVGHPSVLLGTTAEIIASAADLMARDGVDGLDLLAYRHSGDVDAIIRGVVEVSTGPVVVAGSIDSAEQIRAVTVLGAWAFTIGGAVFEGGLPAGPSAREQVDWVLASARDAALPQA
jgi:CheY-like chemotaxis protein